MEYEKIQIRHEVRTEIKADLTRSELDLLVFHKENLHSAVKWKHDKEFELNGEMFDIIYEDHIGDSVYYYCWPDHEESAINKRMDRLITHLLHGSQQSKDRQKNIRHFFNHLFLTETQTNIICPLKNPPTALNKESFDTLQNRQKPQTPPPEII
jgi:hypothetical protein